MWFSGGRAVQTEGTVSSEVRLSVPDTLAKQGEPMRARWRGEVGVHAGGPRVKAGRRDTRGLSFHSGRNGEVLERFE